MQSVPSYKEILKIGIPLMLGSISESISAIVDTAFMGHIGTLAMDGMGMINVVLLLIVMIGWGFSRSIQILVSQNYGADSYENIGKIIFNGVALLLPISLALSILMYYFNGYFLGWVIENNEIRKIASDIAQIRAVGFPLIMMILIISSFFTGIGQTKILIWSQGLAALSNIILNYMLVFGKGGIPAMGYEGSAWATVISEVIGLTILVGYVLSQQELIQKYYLFAQRKISHFLLKETCRLAIPMLIQHAVSLGSWVYFFSLIEKMGEKELAISMVLKQIFSAITIPGFCLASTSNTLVGQLVGSRNVTSILPTIYKIIRLNYAILLSLAILTFIFRTPVVGLFTSDEYVIQNITPSLLALLSAYLFIPSSNVLFVSISALGNTRIPLILESIVIVSYMLYMYIFIQKINGGLLIAWFSETQYWLCLLILGVIYFKYFDWKKNIVYLDKDVA